MRRPASTPTLPSVYEDDHILVVDKPAGQHTQAPAQGKDDSVLATAQKAMGHRLWLVHRLDRDASGLLVLAKTKEAATALSLQFREHTARRTYRAAIAVPLPVGTKGEIDAPLKWAGGKCWVDSSGASALTRYEVVERQRGLTVLEIELETGRMHQIRVHMKHALAPLVGDRKYGGPKASKLHLRAVRLALNHPVTDERLTLSVDGA